MLEDNLYLGKFSLLIRHRLMPSGRKLSSIFQILSVCLGEGFGGFLFIWLVGFFFSYFFLFAIICNHLSLFLLRYHMSTSCIGWSLNKHVVPFKRFDLPVLLTLWIPLELELEVGRSALLYKIKHFDFPLHPSLWLEEERDKDRVQDILHSSIQAAQGIIFTL